MKRRLIAITLVSLLLLFIAAAYWLLATQSGLQTSLRFAQQAVPGLHIGNAQGRLYDGLLLESIQYAPEEGPKVEIAKIDGQWQLWSLLSSRFIVNQLHITKLHVTLPETEEDPSPVVEEQGMFELALPIGIHIRSLRIYDAKLTQPDTEIVLFNRLDTSIRLSHDRLTISSFNLVRPDLAATLVGDLQLSGQYQTNLNYGLQINHADWGPVDVTATINGDLDKFTLRQQVGEPFASEQVVTVNNVLNDLKWQLMVVGESWMLEQLVPEQTGYLEAFDVSGHGDLKSAHIAFNSELNDLQPDLPSLLLSGNFNSDDLQNWLVDTNLTINENADLVVSGSVNIADNENPAFALTSRWEGISWPITDDEKIVEDAQGQIRLTGALKGYQITLNNQARVYDEQLSITSHANGDLGRLTIHEIQVQHAAGELTLDGDMQWQDELKYKLKANWHDLTIPEAISEVKLQILEGNLTLEGDDKQLNAALDSQVDFDEQRYQVRLRADSPQLQTADIKLDVLLPKGAVGFAGNVSMQNTPEANGRLTLRQFDPKLFVKNWPGNLSGQADFSFKQTAESLREIALKDLVLSGQLRERAFQLNADANMVNESVTLSRFDLKTGQSSVQLSGQLQPTLDAKWQLVSPNLNDFLPELTGTMEGSGNIAGELSAIRLKANLAGSDIHYEDMAINEVVVEANVDLSGQNQSGISITANNIHVAEQTIDNLALTLNGQRQQHQLQVDIESPILNLALLANGSLSDSNLWQGQFQTLSFTNPDFGEWYLSEKDKVLLSAESQNIPRHCWQSNTGNVCLEAINSDKGWQAQGELASIPLSLFERFYQDYAKLTGELTGRFSMSSDDQKNYIGEGKFNLNNGSLQLTGDGFRQAEPVDIKTLSLQYQVDSENSALAMTIAPDIAGVSPLEARLQTLPLKEFLAEPSTSQLAMQLQTAIDDLSALNLSHPAIERLEGAFKADLDINGSLEKPEIDSMLSLRNAEVGLSDLGITLTGLNADISGTPQTGINFLLQGQSGDGAFELDGELLLPEEGWQFAANIQGDQVLLMNMPEAYVIASPDLQLALDAASAALKGKLSIPEARLEPMQFNMAVSPSKDVVIVNKPQEEASVLQTDIDIVVSLGDKVQIRAAGFQGDLSGDLAVSGDAGELLLGDGEITLDKGSYVAYGRTLTVNNGKIRFSGGAIDNPDLDVKAVRKLTDVTAGIHLTGPVDNPQATLFSTPSMGQDDILSYILIGRPLNEASAGDGAMLASAATTLGIQNGNALSGEIASTFGLDSVAFTGDSPETAAVKIGKYLSPKLYIGYGIGVLEPVSTVQMRYELSKIWTLQAESGTESGVDLLYIFER
ncbi:translocation/assembly module TamB domain-containing protein [Methylophaga sp. OBS3]|uniref:translocation/assembly module TamB domain-containing protein n=1 Tax=Methylophaga sp. OBS3 TaxID=2991934 RepID=UPI002257B09E|nr:translocation/assembly module TamB domain-containing protein [Methylophaga sp. OBS3]MCX4189184.1 translocation/assembly module TamB domain-containing protein [Methylophaga sp. OBS3]